MCFDLCPSCSLTAAYWPHQLPEHKVQTFINTYFTDSKMSFKNCLECKKKKKPKKLLSLERTNTHTCAHVCTDRDDTQFGLLHPHVLTYDRWTLRWHPFKKRLLNQRDRCDPKSYPNMLKPDLCPGTEAGKSHLETLIYHTQLTVLQRNAV